MGLWSTYGRLLAFGVVLLFDGLVIRPIAFVMAVPQPEAAQWVPAVLLALLAIRLNGVMARRAGTAMPQLVSDLAGAVLFFTGLCVIPSMVFKRDITGFLAADGASGRAAMCEARHSAMMRG